MFQAVPGSRTLRQTTGALGAVALLALGATPAVADDPTPELVLGEIAPVTGLKPGSAFDVPVSFTNTGTEALGKVWLSYSLTQGLSHTELPSNCARYEVGSFDEAPSYSYAVCEFDQTVEPGIVYAPERSQEFKALGKAYTDELRAVVSADDPAPTEGVDEGPVPGTGPAVKLVEQPDATPAAPGSGEHEGWDAADVPVNAVNTADFQVSGAKLKGKVGETLSFEVKFTNAGPAWVRRESGTGATKVVVKMPAGTTVTKAHGFCDKTAARTYECGTSQAWVDPGDGQTYTFKLRIDKAVAGAEGSVKLAGEPRPFDENTANDTAAILLDVAGSGGGSTSGGGTANGGGSTGGGGSTATPSADPTDGGGSTSATGGSTTGGSSTLDGDLASTGSSSTLPLAGAAAAAVAAGTGAVLVVRRRKARP
ncbi:LPXTG-motif cell wall-anchored protein [Streptomyces canus]|uniref:LPXTG cell wall anchor domain-containing protein n=1 Tax=Streptomyces canus TaxID=58343 RepID=UPI00278461EC|nr:LPXTG cell wall anchor domain-containing protein [Streptomyces canus]MDQ0597418.1 LPXTG-motif cell wall-anchored protein [Streptomyces canus]